MSAVSAALAELWPTLAVIGIGLVVLLTAGQFYLTLCQGRQLRSQGVAEGQDGNGQATLEALKSQLDEVSASLREARDRAKEADRANQAKSAFLAMMSHELRTPLSAIIGFAEMIEQQAMGPIGNLKYRDYATDIRLSGQHLLGIINDILDLSKVEAGKESLQESEIEPDEVATAVRVLLEGHARDAEVALTFDCPEDLPLIRVDKRRLTQILVNLMSNAIKFTPAGGEVRLRCWATESSGFVFQAIDNGVGIARENIPLAMSVFGQVENEHEHTPQHGTGLGLPLAKALSELHGGTLDLQSELGEGTTVTLRLPAHRIVARSAAENRATGNRAAG